MHVFLPLFAAAMSQAYGPALPPPPPAAAPTPLEHDDLIGSEAVLRASGMSDAGLRALRGVPQPAIARGATRAAQCAVDQLAARDPLPIGDLASAMEERDATAAAQAQATTRYLVAALGVLAPADRAILMRVFGTGGRAVGSPPPPRPEGARPGADDRRGPGGDRAGGMGRPGPGSPPGGGDRTRGRPPQAGFSGPVLAAPSPCEAMLGG